jgi:hypothetical protein
MASSVSAHTRMPRVTSRRTMEFPPVLGGFPVLLLAIGLRNFRRRVVA